MDFVPPSQKNEASHFTSLQTSVPRPDPVSVPFCKILGKPTGDDQRRRAIEALEACAPDSIATVVYITELTVSLSL